jgi:hypothetical protein
MESLIYSDTRLGRLGKRPLTRPSTPDPVHGPSIFRHEPFPNFRSLTNILLLVKNYRYANRFVVFSQK